MKQTNEYIFFFIQTQGPVFFHSDKEKVGARRYGVEGIVRVSPALEIPIEAYPKAAKFEDVEIGRINDDIRLL